MDYTAADVSDAQFSYQMAQYSNQPMFDADEFEFATDVCQGIPAPNIDQFEDSAYQTLDMTSNSFDFMSDPIYNYCMALPESSSMSFGTMSFPCPPTSNNIRWSSEAPITTSYPANSSNYLDSLSQSFVPREAMTSIYGQRSLKLTPTHSRSTSQASTARTAFDSPSPRFQNEPATPECSPVRRRAASGEPRSLMPKVRAQDQNLPASFARVQPRGRKHGSFMGVVKNEQKPRGRPSHARAQSLQVLSSHMMNVEAPPSVVGSVHRPLSYPGRSSASMFVKPVEQQLRRHSTHMTDANSLSRLRKPACHSTTKPAYFEAVLDTKSRPAAQLSFVGANQYQMSRCSSVSTSGGSYYDVTQVVHDSPQHEPLDYEDDLTPLRLIQPLDLDDQTNEDTHAAQPQTTIQAYLTVPNPFPNLCNDVVAQTVDKNAMWWWWDVRQVRPWTSFNLESMLAQQALSYTLTSPLPTSSLNDVPTSGSSKPRTVSELAETWAKWIIPRLNSALVHTSSSKSKHLKMRRGVQAGEPDFLSVSADLSTPNAVIKSANIVGLVRTWTHWNSGMRAGLAHERTRYLRSLAELHGSMREHSTRYGFLVNETELTVVRNGTEATPDFGFIEIATFDLAQNSSSSTVPKMSAMLALLYLHHLASDTPLPGEAHWLSHVGQSIDMTRSKTSDEPKDVWIPEVKAGLDCRPAKSARGWIFPGDPIARKEKLKTRGVNYGDYRGRHEGV